MRPTVFILLALVLIMGAEMRFINLTIHDHGFRVEIADTPEKQTRGLMFRRSIPENFGMLFTYPDEDLRSFWMKNTRVHLDLIFLDSRQQVVDIFVNVPPCLSEPCLIYTSPAPARYVLEIKGNLSLKLKLQKGDRVFFAFD